jgi:hypothetical protein
VKNGPSFSHFYIQARVILMLMGACIYVKEDCENILSLLDDFIKEDFLRVDEAGLWVNPKQPLGLGWTPLIDIDKPGSPNPSTNPSLPFPFSARQLAATMLGGAAGIIQDRFGAWNCGPDESTLAYLDEQATKAKEVLRLAYQAYRDAQAIVGSLDPALELQADEAKREYEAVKKKARAALGLEKMAESLELQEARRASETASQRAEDEMRAWRKKIVCQLLGTLDAAPEVAHTQELHQQEQKNIKGSQETAEQRQERRYKMCIDRGLKMPDNDYANLPRGIGSIAEIEGVKRQTFAADVKKHINRINGR